MPFRWVNVPETEVNGFDFKLLRGRFGSEVLQPVDTRDFEIDWHSWTYLGTELLSYRILDTNWTRFFEERGDVSRLRELQIPVAGDIQEITI